MPTARTSDRINLKGKKGIWTPEQKKYLEDNYRMKPLKQIAKDMGKSYYSVWRYQKILFNEPDTTEEQSDGVRKPKPILKITVDRDEEKLKVFVQTNKKFEDYLKQTRTTLSTKNLWGKGTPGKYYSRELVSSDMDNINRDIIWNNRINFAVLRMKNVSKGILVESTAMISEEQLADAVNELISRFKQFYKSALSKQRVSGVLYDNDVTASDSDDMDMANRPEQNQARRLNRARQNINGDDIL